MATVSIADLIIDPTVQIRTARHENTVARYAEIFDVLPPVTVVRAKEGYILADGFLRAAAAVKLGRTHIPAIIRSGTRNDALEIAVVANTKNGEALTTEERDRGILRLHALRHSQSDIAKQMSISQPLVASVLAAAKVEQEVVTTRNSGARSLTMTHFREIARAPHGQWQKLADATQKRGWSSAHVALAVKNLNNKAVSASHKQALLKGQANPVIITQDGQVAVPADLTEREVRAHERNDVLMKLERALEALRVLRVCNVDAIIAAADHDRRERLNTQLPGDIKFLQELLRANTTTKLRVVS